MRSNNHHDTTASQGQSERGELAEAGKAVLINRVDLNRMIAEWNLLSGSLWRKELDEGKHRNKTLQYQRESELLCTQKKKM